MTTPERLCRGCGNYSDLLLDVPGSDVPLCMSCRRPEPLTPFAQAFADALRDAFADVDYGAAPVVVTNLAGEVTYRGLLRDMPDEEPAP